jgi:hypothetical protein
MNLHTHNTLAIVLILVALSFLSQKLPAQENDSEELAAIIDAIEKGWEQGDGQPFREHYLDYEGARYIEGGGQNEGLDDLVGHHVEPEGDALADFELNLTNVETHVEGDFAWAVVDVDVKALVKSEQREIHNRGYETFLFRRVGGAWKVVHTHSSSRPVTTETSHEHSEP